MIKRIFDICIATFGIIIFSPLFLLVALLIKFEDNGPVFFRHERIGKFGKKFKIFKFRSMSKTKSAENGKFDVGDTSRITKIGRFIRKTKIDELPQMLNVLIGDMSLVGPRPEVEYWVNAFPDRWKIIHSIKPGITDVASIEFRNEELLLSQSEQPHELYRNEILPRKLNLYEEYVRSQSFYGDLRIILKTINSIITQ